MREINVHELADGAKFNRFHAKVLAWCFLVIIIDGYDWRSLERRFQRS